MQTSPAPESHVSFYPEQFTAGLNSLPTVPAWKPGDPIKEIPRRHTVPSALEHTAQPRGFGPDPLAEAQERARIREDRTFSSSALNFAGHAYTGVNPSDPVGDVGRDYYVQMVNGPSGAIATWYNKNDGSIAAGPYYLDTQTIHAPCNNGLGDPMALYDHEADRWILSEFSGTGNALCIWVSRSSDPISGPWGGLDHPTPNFPDYPKMAMWQDAYYISTNESGGPAAYAFNRQDMAYTAGAVATVRRTATSLAGFGFQALTPSDLEGESPPPPGAPNYFMRHRDDEVHGPLPPVPSEDYLEIWEFRADPADWFGSSTFALAQTVTVSEFDSDLCGLVSFECFPQPGTATLLDPLREVIMHRLVYRNFGTHEALIGSFVTDVTGSDRGGIRWFELRRQRPGVGTWQLYQEGTFSPSSTNRWMSSIAMDGGGNIAMGYNVTASAGIWPGIRRVGRFANDPLGLMTVTEALVVAGAAANASIRYGDYNALTLDPVDDCTFWMTGQYNPTSEWGTRISTFRFSRCPNELDTFVGDEEAAAPEECEPPEEGAAGSACRQ